MTISSYTGTSFDWSANMGVDAVFVKGGPGGNLYLYAPEATWGAGLTAPNPGGQIPNIGHILFCYDVGLTQAQTVALSGTASGGSLGGGAWQAALVLAAVVPMLAVIPLGRLRRRR